MREWVTTYFSYQLGTYTAAEKIRGVIFFKDGIKSSEKKAKAPALAEGAGARRRPNDGPLLHWTCTCTTIAHWYTIKFYYYYYKLLQLYYILLWREKPGTRWDVKCRNLEDTHTLQLKAHFVAKNSCWRIFASLCCVQRWTNWVRDKSNIQMISLLTHHFFPSKKNRVKGET